MEPTRKSSFPKPSLDDIIEETSGSVICTPRMNGQNSSRNPKPINNGPTVGKAAANIPTLRIQAETPIPSSTRGTPVPSQNGISLPGVEKSIHLPALSSARSLVSDKSTPRQTTNKSSEQKPFPHHRQPTKQSKVPVSNQAFFNRRIKNDVGDVGFGPQCVGLHTTQQNQTHQQQASNIFPASNTLQNLSSKSSSEQLHLPNQHLQTNTPTPSEVSLIQCTSRGNISTAYSVSSERNSLSTPGGLSISSDKAVFLEPQPKQQDWTHFKPLPSVPPAGTNSITSSEFDQFGHHAGSISQYQSSVSNLSPSQDMSLYTSNSLFTSPRNSASIHHRAAQKRALSISPSISDGFDLNQIIRFSPTSLIKGSRSSSVSFSPQPGQPCGAFSHQSARNSPYPSNGSGGNSRMLQTQFTAHSKHEHANLYNIVPSENSVSFADLMRNQCVAPLNDIPYIEQNYQASQFVPAGTLGHSGLPQNPMPNYCLNNGLNNPMNSAMNNMNVNGLNSAMNNSMITNMDTAMNDMHIPIRPPPPYSQAVEQQQLQHHHHQHPQSQQQPLLPLQQQHNINNYIQNIPTSTSTGVKHEILEDDGTEEKHFCEWIDCKASFKERDELVRHIEKVHIDQRKGDDFTCFWQGCQRRYRPFNARYKLLIHMRVHSGEKPNKCTFENCDKAFSRLENLKIHLRSHTGERPYLCTFKGCSKAFSNSSDRAKHQRTHLDTKPYACQVPGCTKRYTDPSSLRKHVKNHSQKDQQIKKKMKTEQDTSNQPDILKDCLKINQFRSNASPMDQSERSMGRSPHPVFSNTDLFSNLNFGNLSSRVGSTSISSQHSPSSIAHGSPMNTGLPGVDESNESIGGYSPAPNHSMLSPRPLPPIPQHTAATQSTVGLTSHYNFNYNQEISNPYPQYSAARNPFFNSNAYTSANSCRMGMMQAQRNYANYQSYNYEEQNYINGGDLQKAFNNQQAFMDPIQGQQMESFGLTAGGDEMNLQQYLQLSAVDRANSRTSALYAEGST